MKPEPEIRKRRVPGGVSLLAIVVVLYGIAFAGDPGSAELALRMGVAMLWQLAPVLALVLVLMFLTNLMLRPHWVRTHVGEDSGWRGWAIALVGGILSMGPIYAWYPLLKELKARGMRTALVSVFLYNRAIKLPLLPLMIQYFGLGYTLVLGVYMTVLSLVGGLVLERIVDRPAER